MRDWKKSEAFQWREIDNKEEVGKTMKIFSDSDPYNDLFSSDDEQNS